MEPEADFDVIRLSDDLLVGSARDGRRVVLVENGRGPTRPIALESMVVRWDVKALIEVDKEVVRTAVDVLVVDDSQFDGTVERLCRSLVAASTVGESSRATLLRLIEIFSQRRLVRRTDALGLWGELALIVLCPDPSYLASRWRLHDAALLDFGGQDGGIEVKITTQRTRIHHLTLAQVEAGPEVWLASLMTDRIATGDSIFDLLDRLRPDLERHEHDRLIETAVNTLGTDAGGVEELTFDLEAARRSLQFHAMDALPRPQVGDERISDVRFRLNANGLETSWPLPWTA